MSLIAEVAGTGMGTIYNYFETKERLINALYLKLKEDEAKFMTQGFNPKAETKTRFSYLWYRIFSYFLRKPIEFQFLEHFYFSPMIELAVKKRGAEFYDELVQVYRDGQQQNVLKKGSVIEQIYFTHGSLASLAKFHISGDIKLTDKAMKEAIQSAWNALKK